MQMEKIIGALMFFIGTILILNSFSGITGFVVAESIGKGISSILGFALIVGGILFMAEGREEKEGNLAQKILDSGAIILDPRKLRKIAKKISRQQKYFGKEVKEGYQILDANGNPLTVIPHNHISKGVYHNIMEVLATGESNFRKRTGYSPA